MKKISNCLWCNSKNLELFAHRKDGVGILKCKDCKLLMVDQIPDNLDEYYYDEGYFTVSNKHTESYAEIYDLMSPAFLFWQNSFIEEVNESHDKKLFLEIGVATGNLLEILRDNQKNLTLKGIDISKYAIKVAPG